MPGFQPRRPFPPGAAVAEAPPAVVPNQLNGCAGSAVVRFGFPQGSLQKSTENLFSRAGFKVKISERGYFPSCDDEELQMMVSC